MFDGVIPLGDALRPLDLARRFTQVACRQRVLGRWLVVADLEHVRCAEPGHDLVRGERSRRHDIGAGRKTVPRHVQVPIERMLAPREPAERDAADRFQREHGAPEELVVTDDPLHEQPNAVRRQ
jgi:hypothetical protein